MTDSRATSAHVDPAEHLALLWADGAIPDLDRFVAGHPNLSPSDLAAVVRVDQARRWERGTRLFTEHYFDRFPTIRNDPSAALDLIHYEFIIRESLGPPPSLGEFTARFPEHASTIKDQIAIHLALATDLNHEKAVLAGRSWDSRHGLGTDSSRPAPPTRFGRYRLLERLGQGAMGTVYRACDDQLDREVALKVLRVGPDLDGHLASRFLREARIAGSFTDPRLCPVYDAGILDGFHYFTMPLITGETLATRFKRDGLVDPHVAVQLVATIARAVSIAHSAGVVHRDLKPANVMMTSAGLPVVLDFGLARRDGARDAVATEDGVVLGTPAYMAPEQIGGESRYVGPPADIYGLGVILYQLLCGRLPFGGSSHELMRKALTENPVPPSKIRPGLDTAIDRVCLRAMAREISERFRSMDSFADALESCLDRTATVAPRPRRRHTGRHRVVVLTLSAILGLTALGFYSASFRASSITARPQPAFHFPVGATWSGRFVFRGRLSGYEGDVVLTITKSEGDAFQGKYSTEGGRFAWDVSGVERDDHIHWEFVRATKGDVRPTIVGQAHVSGHYRNGILELIFTDGDSSADLILTRSP